jgi:hypothetical protein
VTPHRAMAAVHLWTPGAGSKCGGLRTMRSIAVRPNAMQRFKLRMPTESPIKVMTFI